MEMNSGSGSDNSDHSFSKEAFEEHKDSCKWDFIIKTLPKSLAELRPKMELLESTSLFNQIKHYHRDVYCARFCLNLIKQIEVIRQNAASGQVADGDGHRDRRACRAIRLRQRHRNLIGTECKLSG